MRFNRKSTCTWWSTCHYWRVQETPQFWLYNAKKSPLAPGAPLRRSCPWTCRQRNRLLIEIGWLVLLYQDPFEECWNHVWLLSGGANNHNPTTLCSLERFSQLYQEFHESHKSRGYNTWNFKKSGLVHHFAAPFVSWSLSIWACIKGPVTQSNRQRAPNITKPGKGTAGFQPWACHYEAL